MNFKELNRKLVNDEENEDYIGNIWGWKFSFFGLAIIILTGILLAYGHYSGKVNFNEGIDGTESINPYITAPAKDSLK